MPIFTGKHCLICYKEDGAKPNPNNSKETETDSKIIKSDENAPPDANMTFASNIKALNKNSEICRRFCTLASRYYNMEDELVMPEKTLNSKWAVNIDRACATCAERLSSFCDIYASWQYLQMQLDQRASEILEVMKEADDESNLEYAPHKRALVQEMKQNELTMHEIDEFRNELKSSISKRKRKMFPLLEVDPDKADDLVLFETIPPKKKSKRALEPEPETKPASPEKSETESVWESPPPKKLCTMGYNLPPSSSPSPPSSEDDEDDDEFSDLFIPVSVAVPVSKKSKRISLDSARTDNTSSRMSLISMSKVEGDPIKAPDQLVNHGRGRGSKPGSVTGGSDHGISSMVNETKNKSTNHIKRSQRASSKTLHQNTNSHVSTCSLPTKSGAMRATWEEIRSYLNLPEEPQLSDSTTPSLGGAVEVDLTDDKNEADSDKNPMHIRKMRVCYTCPTCGLMFPTTGDCVVHQQSIGHRSNPAITIFRS